VENTIILLNRLYGNISMQKPINNESHCIRRISKHFRFHFFHVKGEK